MKIFLSHSLTDHELINKLSKSLVNQGLSLLIAEHHFDLANNTTEKIENMIKNCDGALILLTENGYNSHFVQQEIGYIKAQKKPYLQLIQSGFENKIKGFNYGKDYILYDPNNPQTAVDKVERTLTSWNKKILDKQSKLIKLNKIKTKQEESQTKFGIVMLAILLVLFLSGD